MTQDQINQILELHKLWLQDDPKGKRADLSDAYLHGVDLSSANLSRANLSDADLSGADLPSASLSCADLSGTDLSRANLSSANLFRADLSYANLLGADLSSANTKNTIIEQKALISFNFDGKHAASFDGIDTIKIGCHSHSIDYWIKNFKTIGAKEGYTEKQISVYGKFIKGCKAIQNDTK